MSLYVSLENQNFDLNKMFQFSYSFDVLKQLIYTLVKSNKNTSYQLQDIEDEVNDKTKSVNKIRSNLEIEKETNVNILKEADNNNEELVSRIATLTRTVNYLTEIVQTFKKDGSLNVIDEELMSKNLKSLSITREMIKEEVKNKVDEELNNRIKNEESKKSEKKSKVIEERKKQDSIVNNDNRFGRTNENEFNLDNQINLNTKNTFYNNTKGNFNVNNKNSTNNVNMGNNMENINNVNNNTNNNGNNMNDLRNNNNFNNNYNNSNNVNNRRQDNMYIMDNENHRNNNDNTNNNNNQNNLGNNNYVYNYNYEYYDNNNDNNNNNTRNYGNENHNNNNNTLGSDERLNRIGNNQIKLEEQINKMTKKIAKIELDLGALNNTFNTGNFNNIDEDVDPKKLEKMRESMKFDIKKQANISNSIEELKSKIMNLEVKGNSFEEKLNEITVKMTDLDIYSALNTGGENTNIDQALLLVQSLEKKILKKFEFSDQKIKKVEDDQNKIKNDYVVKFEKRFDQIKDELNDLNLDMNRILSQDNTGVVRNNSDLRDIDRKIGSTAVNKEEINKIIDSRISELESQKRLNNEDDIISLSYKVLSDKIGEFINQNLEIDFNRFSKEANKKLNELDKQLKVMQTTVNIDKINNDIFKLNENLSRKINLEDFSELKSNTNLISHQVTYLKDTLSQIVDDRKVLEDISFLRKKVENLTNSMMNFKTTDELNSTGSKGNMNVDQNKFLENNVFHTFHKNYVKDMEFLKSVLEDNKTITDEIKDKLRTKVSDSDLKNLEDYLVNRMEEGKIHLAKKFADKIETQKSIKYIEAQVKHVVEVYVKKMEKGENWLLAKKPVDGYTCASCENYIGDLNDKSNDYKPWEKYPLRNTSDKAYKVGNGFSRMLQMLNIDLKKTYNNEADYTDLEDLIRTQSKKKNNELPNIHKKNNSKEKKGETNKSIDNAYNSDENYIKSKVVKIVKKKVV